ncbi:PTS sugar transporter subunit IIA [Candidatus Enterococcus willemsii]|uniref:PTS sugar transporter subunit IIA n=1 Tax=Candidatus Enterococcus willemsii TaxID=1857215 RepID=A0ABQ6YW60_9ENTE|nr:PTS sugar transporter subunit IIA [Enterococcus sp. CU12B]KAF1301931.1 PTS sugar transporter subunit IIA [Enterococcus sp. CU12B]
MSYKEMFHSDLVELHLQVDNEEEAFEVIGTRLKELGYVNEGYLEGIKRREQAFPTGLITQYLNIGLPHSDPEFVEKPFIYIVRLVEDVTCRQMGDSREMNVKNLFFLGIKNGKEQVGLLQSFMNLFMDENFVSTYTSLDKKEEIYQLFVNHI